jgi:predicted Zn-ribbon and HTH transcriptional regulator
VCIYVLAVQLLAIGGYLAMRLALVVTDPRYADYEPHVWCVHERIASVGRVGRVVQHGRDRVVLYCRYCGHELAEMEGQAELLLTPARVVALLVERVTRPAALTPWEPPARVVALPAATPTPWELFLDRALDQLYRLRGNRRLERDALTRFFEDARRMLGQPEQSELPPIWRCLSCGFRFAPKSRADTCPACNGAAITKAR